MPQANPSGSEEERLLSLRDVLGTLERRRWTVAGGVLTTVVAALAWLANASPLYRAEATLLLEDPGATSGFLGQLAALGSAPAAESEMAVLRSREIARRTAAHTDGSERARASGALAARGLALTTQVDDPLLKPLAVTLGRDALARSVRVEARVERAHADAPTGLEVQFDDAGGLRLRAAGLVPAGNDWRSFPDASDGPFELEGATLRLDWQGDVRGRTFRVRALSLEEAVDELVARTGVRETERNSGVIRISFDDADPRRAAEVVNALCDNYREYSVGRARRGASRAIEFIEAQLGEQLESLEQAERELVELQSAAPESIDVDATAGALVEQMTALETHLVETQLVAASLEDALAALSEEERSALSQLQVQLDDPVTAGYLEAITRLTAEAESQSRSDAGPYKLLKQTKLEELRTRQEALELAHANLTAVAQALEDGDESGLARLEASPDPGDPITAGYLGELARVRSELAVLLVTLTEEHPAVEDRQRTIDALHDLIRAQVASLLRSADEERDENAHLIATYEETLGEYAAEERARLVVAIDRIVARTREHLASRKVGLERKQHELGEQLTALRERLAALPEAQRDQADTLRRLRTHEAVAELLLRSRQEAGITEASTVPAAEVLDRALPPRSLHFPRPVPTLLLSMAVGLAAGAFLAFVRDRLSGHVASEAELESVTGLEVLGSIPNFRRGPARVRGAGARFLALLDDPDGITADAYRSLRASLRFATRGERDVRVLGVTSAVASEGKTSTNVNIALACAAAGERVLLVDSDLRRPAVHRFLELGQSPGLGEVLNAAADADWRVSVRQRAAGDLDVMPAGRTSSSSGDLLADAERLDTFLSAVREEYDLVILDLPPVLATSDALAVVGRLDAVLLLYRSEGAPAGALRLAAGKLRRAGANLVGAVLCALRPTRYGDTGYASYYGYGYGNEPSKPKRERAGEPAEVA